MRRVEVLGCTATGCRGPGYLVDDDGRVLCRDCWCFCYEQSPPRSSVVARIKAYFCRRRP